jgi:outer membrane protein assembly factor BamB
VIALAGFAIALASRSANAYDWLEFNGNPQHSGNNTQESTIARANVATLATLFQVTLPAVADGAPVVLTGVSTSTGTRDLLFVNTKDGRILAIDAHTGVTVWQNQYPPGSCTVNGNGSLACFTTSSPAIDPARTFVYAYGLDGNVHKYSAGSGAEVTGSGWPEATTLKPFNEKCSSALAIATAASGSSYLYVAHGGYPGDNGDYQGHVTSINLSTGAQNVFNTACSSETVHFVETPGTPDCSSVRSAVWARGGVVYSATLDEIFIGTGNGDFIPGSGDWGDSILALSPAGVGLDGGPIDSYTPTNYQSLEATDSDLGSTDPALLPVPANSNVAQLAVQSGKDGLLRLLNLANLSTQGGPGHLAGHIGTITSVPQGGGVLTDIAVWVNPADSSTWAFVANGNGTSGLELAIDANGNPSLTAVWQTSNGGSSPLVANNVLFVASSGALRALSPLTGATLWTAPAGLIGGIHWESPVVANGVVYVTDESARLTAFAPLVEATPALPRPVAWLVGFASLLAGILALRAPQRISRSLRGLRDARARRSCECSTSSAIVNVDDAARSCRGRTFSFT